MNWLSDKEAVSQLQGTKKADVKEISVPIVILSAAPQE
jgi:hypothetical protein